MPFPPKAFNRVSAALTIFVFSSNSLLSAQPAQPLALPASIEVKIPDTLQIPENLGSIQTQHFEDSSKPFVLYIQDAHAIVDAQQNIERLIEFAQKEYGIDTVAIEGAKNELDPTLFRSFPDKFIKRRVMRNYLQRGEIGGAEGAAIFSSHQAVFTGLEDWPLYEKNYAAYLEAKSKEPQLLAELDNQQQDLDRARNQIYSAELNQFHETWAAFQNETENLVGLLQYFATQQMTENFPHLTPLLQSVTQENENADLNVLIRQIAASFKKKRLAKLTREKQIEFNRAHQALLSGAEDPASLLTFMNQNARLKLTPQMREALGQAETFSMIKGTQLFDELETFAKNLQKKLITTSEQRALAERYEQLRLLRGLAKLELSRKEWEKIVTRRSSLEARESRVTSDGALTFYRLALQRDAKFMTRLQQIMKERKTRAAIVITGGFHAKGFEQHLREAGYSYAIVTPKINSLDGQDVYAGVMQGKLSYKQFLKTTYYDAFARHATIQLVNGLGELDFKRNLKIWRDEVIRSLADQGRTAEASKYTRYIDLLLRIYQNKFGDNAKLPSKEEMMKMIRAELDKLKTETFASFPSSTSLPQPAALVNQRVLDPSITFHTRSETRTLETMKPDFGPSVKIVGAIREELDGMVIERKSSFPNQHAIHRYATLQLKADLGVKDPKVIEEILNAIPKLDWDSNKLAGTFAALAELANNPDIGLETLKSAFERAPGAAWLSLRNYGQYKQTLDRLFLDLGGFKTLRRLFESNLDHTPALLRNLANHSQRVTLLIEQLGSETVQSAILQSPDSFVTALFLPNFPDESSASRLFELPGLGLSGDHRAKLFVKNPNVFLKIPTLVRNNDAIAENLANILLQAGFAASEMGDLIIQDPDNLLYTLFLLDDSKTRETIKNGIETLKGLAPGFKNLFHAQASSSLHNALFAINEFERQKEFLIPYFSPDGKFELNKFMEPSGTRLIFDVYEVASLHAALGVIGITGLAPSHALIGYRKEVNGAIVKERSGFETRPFDPLDPEEAANPFVTFVDSSRFSKQPATHGMIQLPYFPSKFAGTLAQPFPGASSAFSKNGGRRLFVAASPSEQEADALIRSIDFTQPNPPLLVLGMRASDLALRMADDLKKRGYRVRLWDKGVEELPDSPEADILILNVQGKLAGYFDHADLAFVGADRNIFEPAGRTPVVAFAGNWRVNTAARDLLERHGALLTAQPDPYELRQAIQEALENREALIEAAKKAIDDFQRREIPATSFFTSLLIAAEISKIRQVQETAENLAAAINSILQSGLANSISQRLPGHTLETFKTYAENLSQTQPPSKAFNGYLEAGVSEMLQKNPILKSPDLHNGALLLSESDDEEGAKESIVTIFIPEEIYALIAPHLQPEHRAKLFPAPTPASGSADWAKALGPHFRKILSEGPGTKTFFIRPIPAPVSPLSSQALQEKSPTRSEARTGEVLRSKAQWLGLFRARQMALRERFSYSARSSALAKWALDTWAEKTPVNGIKGGKDGHWIVRYPENINLNNLKQHEKVLWRISLNVGPNEEGIDALIKTLDSILSTPNFRAYAKFPDNGEGWSNRQDSVTIYVLQDSSDQDHSPDHWLELQAQLRKTIPSILKANRIERFIREGNTQIRIGEAVSGFERGVMLVSEPSPEQMQAIIHQAAGLGPEAQAAVQAYFSKRDSRILEASPAMFEAVRLVLAEELNNEGDETRPALPEELKILTNGTPTREIETIEKIPPDKKGRERLLIRFKGAHSPLTVTHYAFGGFSDIYYNADDLEAKSPNLFKLAFREDKAETILNNEKILMQKANAARVKGVPRFVAEGKRIWQERTGLLLQIPIGVTFHDLYDTPLHLHERIRAFGKMLEIVRELVQKRITPLDLKPANTVLTNDGEVFLIDLAAYGYEGRLQTETFQGTSPYSMPLKTHGKLSHYYNQQHPERDGYHWGETFLGLRMMAELVAFFNDFVLQEKRTEDGEDFEKTLRSKLKVTWETKKWATFLALKEIEKLERVRDPEKIIDVYKNEKVEDLLNRLIELTHTLAASFPPLAGNPQPSLPFREPLGKIEDLTKRSEMRTASGEPQSIFDEPPPDNDLAPPTTAGDDNDYRFADFKGRLFNDPKLKLADGILSGLFGIAWAADLSSLLGEYKRTEAFKLEDPSVEDYLRTFADYLSQPEVQNRWPAIYENYARLSVLFKPWRAALPESLPPQFQIDGIYPNYVDAFLKKKNPDLSSLERDKLSGLEVLLQLVQYTSQQILAPNYGIFRSAHGDGRMLLNMMDFIRHVGQGNTFDLEKLNQTIAVLERAVADPAPLRNPNLNSFILSIDLNRPPVSSQPRSETRAKDDFVKQRDLQTLQLIGLAGPGFDNVGPKMMAIASAWLESLNKSPALYSSTRKRTELIIEAAHALQKLAEPSKIPEAFKGHAATARNGINQALNLETLNTGRLSLALGTSGDFFKAIDANSRLSEIPKDGLPQPFVKRLDGIREQLRQNPFNKKARAQGMQLIPYFELIVGPLSRSSLQQGDRVARALLAVFMEALEESFENGQPIDQELQIAAAKYAMSNKISGTLESFVNFTAQLLPIERERLSNLLDRNPNPKIPDIQKALPEERHPALTKLSNLSHGYDGNDIHFPRYLELALRVQTFLNPRSETRMRFPELEPLMPDYNRSARRWHRELQHRSQSLRAEASDLSSRSEMRSIEGKSNLEAPIGTALSQFWESVAVNIETAAQGKDSQAVLDYLFPVGVSDPFGEGVQRLANQMKVPAEMQRQLAYETLNRIRGLFAGALILGGSASLRVSTGPAIEVSPALRELFSQDEATMNQTLNEVYTRWYQTKFNRLPDQPLVNPKSRSAIILSANMLGSNQTQIQNLFAQLTEGSKTTGVLYDVATPTESQALALMRLYKVLIPVAHRMGSKVMQTRLGQSFQQETRWFLAKGEPTILELSDRAQNEGLQYDDLGLDLEVAYKIGNLVLDSAELLKKVEDDPSGIRILSRTAVGAILSFLDELVTNYQGNVTAQRAA